VAHFLNKMLFCLFAEDTGLLPRDLFTRLLENGAKAPAHFQALLSGLFRAMAKSGVFGEHVIDWFNGGLFDTDQVLPLEPDEIKMLAELARLDWSAIEPSIFGTLFERGLDPDKRSQLGAHFTDPGSIMRIVNPVVVEPLRDEWAETKVKIGGLLDKAKAATKATNEADRLYQGFLSRLAAFRILDPACGSGNSKR
jgi:MmeI, helicase spacer domain